MSPESRIIILAPQETHREYEYRSDGRENETHGTPVTAESLGGRSLIRKPRGFDELPQGVTKSILFDIQTRVSEGVFRALDWKFELPSGLDQKQISALTPRAISSHTSSSSPRVVDIVGSCEENQDVIFRAILQFEHDLTINSDDGNTWSASRLALVVEEAEAILIAGLISDELPNPVGKQRRIFAFSAAREEQGLDGSSWSAAQEAVLREVGLDTESYRKRLEEFEEAFDKVWDAEEAAADAEESAADVGGPEYAGED